MADVRPLRGIRYDGAVAGDLSGLVCPPFDVIPPALQDRLYERSPYNVVRLELGRDRPGDGPGNDRYSRAAETQTGWLEAGVLARDPAPAMYLIEESFEFAGRGYHRRGLIAAVRLEEFDRGVVLPHEYTRPGPKVDRLALMRAASANYSPLMVLYRDRGGAIGRVLSSVSEQPPAAAAAPPELPAFNLWLISDPAALREIAGALSNAPLYMADGHHRYETAITYRDEVRAGGGLEPDDAANFRMMTLISIDDPGLLLLGYHRALGSATPDELSRFKTYVRDAFYLTEWTPPAGGPDVAAPAFEAELARGPDTHVVFGFAGLEPDRLHIGVMKDPAPAVDELEACEYTRLHDEVFRSTFTPEREAEVVAFEHDTAAVLAQVASGERQIGFIMRAMPLEPFEAVVTKGQRLPSKSTFFHPKLHTGAVIQPLEGAL
ncbi:MAG: DUF1015 domain-containing protein [Dehalococcoidia bacterium]